jgi:hypothetical protein
MKDLLNCVFLLILTYILCYLIVNKNPLEHFYPNIFRVDTRTILPNTYPRCTPENNCFPGTYARTQSYQNVCEPKTGLLRQKIPLQDNCLRKL